MKKILCLIIALCCALSLVACGETGGDDGDAAFFATVEASKPAKVTTLTNYVFAEGDSLNGEFVTTVSDGGYVFAYEYQRYGDPAKGDTERITTEKGTVYYENGKYSTDNVNWYVEAPDAALMQMQLNISKEALGSYQFNEAGTTLTTKLSAAEAEAFIGIKLSATTDVTVTVSTNGTYLTRVTLSYETANASVSVNTSYSYN